MPRYFLDLPEARLPLPWDPHAGRRSERADTAYFGAVFVEMERRLRDPDIDVYLTWNTRRLPAYGSRVVAVVLGDEAAGVPRYSACVRAVFKSYGTRPPLGAGPLRNPGLTGVAEAAQWAVRELRRLPGAAAARGARSRARYTRSPATIPLGTFNTVELPLVPIEERATDLFFAGSVEHDPSLVRRLSSPKTRARREMLAALAALEDRRGGLRVDLRLTPSFAASEAASALEYSRALMDARVCLAPRGTSLETFRVFEGLRFGCVVVSDRLPDHVFYRGSPVVQLDRWSDLDRMLGPILDDPAELRRRQRQALDWWRDHCSEAAVGAFIAKHLNELP